MEKLKKPEDLDLIILGTDSPDFITPATSVVLQHKLGAKYDARHSPTLQVLPDACYDAVRQQGLSDG